MLKVILYYSDKCGHCIEFKKEWEMFKNKYNRSRTVKTEEYNASQYRKEMIAMGITYIPCIRIVKNEQIFNYSGQNTFIDLDKYIQSINY